MLARETVVFLSACLLGAGFGLLYDAFRILRIFLPHNSIITFLEDLLYCFVLILSSFAFVVSIGNGVLRGFIIFGELIGATLYFFSIGIIITKFAKNLKRGLCHIIFLIKKQKPLEFATKDGV